MSSLFLPMLFSLKMSTQMHILWKQLIIGVGQTIHLGNMSLLHSTELEKSTLFSSGIRPLKWCARLKACRQPLLLTSMLVLFVDRGGSIFHSYSYASVKFNFFQACQTSHELVLPGQKIDVHFTLCRYLSKQWNGGHLLAAGLSSQTRQPNNTKT